MKDLIVMLVALSPIIFCAIFGIVMYIKHRNDDDKEDDDGTED